MSRINFLEAISTMVGCIVGAGILGIPYVVAKAGFMTGMVNIIILGAFVMILYLYMGEVILRTNGRHQLTGYAERYLGRWGKLVMAFSMVFGVYGALSIYLIGEGNTLSAILGGSPTIYTLLFFLLVSILTYSGLETLEKSELLTMFGIMLVIFTIILFTTPHIKAQNFTGFDLKNMFLPYGAILFAYLGMISIPEVKEILGKDRKHMKKAIIIGMLIPIIIYSLFVIVVVGSVSLGSFENLAPNQRTATIALGEVISPTLFILANIFAVFAMFTSFLAVAFALKEMFMYDYNLGKKSSWALTCFIPLFIALSNAATFIQMLTLVGIVVGGIDAILILMMFHEAKKHGDRVPEYSMKESYALSVLIMVLFVAGVVSLLL